MARMARSSAGVREEYAEVVRFLCDTPAARLPGCPWPERLACLEAGEVVVVAGWEVGLARDFDRYELHADGHLEQVAR